MNFKTEKMLIIGTDRWLEMEKLHYGLSGERLSLSVCVQVHSRGKNGLVQV